MRDYRYKFRKPAIYFMNWKELQPQVQTYLDRHYPEANTWIGFNETDLRDVMMIDPEDTVLHIDFDGDGKSDGFFHIDEYNTLSFDDDRRVMVKYNLPIQEVNKLKGPRKRSEMPLPLFFRELPLDAPLLPDSRGRITESMMAISDWRFLNHFIPIQFPVIFPNTHLTLLTPGVSEYIQRGDNLLIAPANVERTVDVLYSWLQDRILPTQNLGVRLVYMDTLADRDPEFSIPLELGGNTLVRLSWFGSGADGASVLSSSRYLFVDKDMDMSRDGIYNLFQSLAAGREIIFLSKPNELVHIDMAYAPSEVMKDRKQVLFVGDLIIPEGMCGQKEHKKLCADRDLLHQEAKRLEETFHVVRVPLIAHEMKIDEDREKNYSIYSYLNLLMEDYVDSEGKTKRRVILPHFEDASLTNNRVKSIFERYGYEVAWVKGFEKLAPYNGALRCKVQVLSRE